MVEKSIRLNAVVKELNVGMQTLVEHLAKKGHAVEAKPTAKISEEQYQILLSDFQSDKKVSDDARQMVRPKFPKKEEPIVAVSKGKEIRLDEEEDDDDGILIKSGLSPTSSKKAEPIAPPKEEKKEEKKEKKEIVLPPVKEKEPEAEEDDDKVKLTVIGKIDLDGMNTKTRPDKKPKAKKGKEKEEEVKPKKAAKEVAEKKGAKTVSRKETKEKVETEEAPIIVEKQEEKQEIKVDKKVENTQEPNYEKLSGLKVLGKIELPVEQVHVPKKFHTDNAAGDLSKSKKKRKRKNFVTGSEDPNLKKTASPIVGKETEKVFRRDPNRKPQGTGTGRFSDRGRSFESREPKAEITEKEIQDKLKETLARLNPGSKTPNIGSVRSKIRKQKRDAASDKREEELHEQEGQRKKIKVTEFVTANELAKMLDVQITQIISACMSLGLMVSINQRLDAETIAIVADEFSCDVEFVSATLQENIEEEEDKPEDLKPRAPIVTVMGHVDHGKTSLLDHIRKTNVIAGEAGGITQHIGAYEVTLQNGKKVTFLDTPGHEAFTAMRARGAKITDIVIVVIAADDSVMPQTKEAISHAQAAGVPIIFAINKIDREGANADKIREQLSAMDILVEEWGGKYQCQEISAKKGLNIDQLLEKVLLEAEMLNLKANANKRAIGSVIEATLDKGRGITTTVMVQAGTLRVGDPILAGVNQGKVRAMFDERGKKMEVAGPSTPVMLLGFDGAPQAGDKFMVPKSEQEAKEIANKRQQLQREQGIRSQKHITLDEIGRRLAIGNFKELNLIVKGDVDGSVEALSDSLLKLSNTEIHVNVIHKSVGQISESDVLLASASDAIIIGFQVRPSPQARKLAEQESIDIRLYSIIYKAIEEIQAAIEGMLAPKMEEKITGNAEIREVFKVSKVGSVAGCMVTDGKIFRNSKVRLIREGVVVYTGELSSLKRFKDDAKEVVSGFDCGLTIANFNDIKVGDNVEGYEEVEVKRALK
ncbi:MAG: translation initiation factor IF-2 [Bacteroidia bacterium]